MLQLKKPLAVIDIEATGTNVSSDRIVEIAIVKLLPDGNRTVKRKIINPQKLFSIIYVLLFKKALFSLFFKKNFGRIRPFHIFNQVSRSL